MESEIKPESHQRRIRRAQMSYVETIKVRKSDRDRRKKARQKVKEASLNQDSEYSQDYTVGSSGDYVFDLELPSIDQLQLPMATAPPCIAVSTRPVLKTFIIDSYTSAREKPVISLTNRVNSSSFVVNSGEDNQLYGPIQPQSTASLSSLQRKQGWTLVNRYVGTKVMKIFDNTLYYGVVTRFMRAKRKGYMKGPALYHIVYNDDDEEDVCLHELYACIDLLINCSKVMNDFCRNGFYK